MKNLAQPEGQHDGHRYHNRTPSDRNLHAAFAQAIVALRSVDRCGTPSNWIQHTAPYEIAEQSLL